MEGFSGGCLCGAVRYAVSAEPIISGACYCRDCQYVSGGAPAFGMLLPRDGLTVTVGEPAVHWIKAESGNRVGRHFCPACGTHLFAENEGHPEYVSLKAGSLDTPEQFMPAANVWVGSAQPWHAIDASLPQWEGNPT